LTTKHSTTNHPKIRQHILAFLPGPVTTSDRLQSSNTSSPQLPQQQNQTALMPDGNAAVTEKRHDIAWKYEGYQDFSKWMASDDDFFIFRRFENANARVLLWMQHQIEKKEARLGELHDIIEKSPIDNGLRNDSFNWDTQYLKERDDLTQDLSDLLLKYSQYLNVLYLMQRFALTLTRSKHRGFQQNPRSTVSG
jgi:hypothetical protein